MNIIKNIFIIVLLYFFSKIKAKMKEMALEKGAACVIVELL